MRFWVYKMLFTGYEKLLHFRRSKGSHQLLNCSWNFGRSKAARVRFNGRRPKKQPQKQQKAQTTWAAQAEASCTNNREHQTAATQEKKASKGSAKAAKEATETRGGKAGPQRSQASFEIPVNFIIICYLLFASNGELINCKIVLDILEGQKRPGFNCRRTKKRQLKQDKQQKKQNSASRNKKKKKKTATTTGKAQTTSRKIVPNSSNTAAQIA